MLLIGFIPFFTFALGTWQLQRLQWKIALIDELEEKLQLQPLSLPEKIKYDPMVLNFLSDCISYYQSVRDP
jgi:surfeit locus 1 family protein